MAQLGQSWIGSVSTATCRDEDLIPAFESVLRQTGNKFPKGRPVEVCNLLNNRTVSEQGFERISWYIGELFDALDAIAPNGCYFGAHPDDGADFGFWPLDEDSAECPLDVVHLS